MILLYFPFALLRLLVQSMFLALGQVWTNKLRSALTMMGIIIGVASVSAVIGTLVGLEANVRKEFDRLGTTLFMIYPRAPENMRRVPAVWERIRFAPHDFDRMLENCPSVARFSRQAGFSQQVSYHGTDVGSQITGIDPDWHDLEKRYVSEGRPFSAIDDAQARFVCLLNTVAKVKLGLTRGCVGESVLIGNRHFIVTGVIESRADSALMQERTPVVFIPFNTALKLYPNLGYGVEASARSAELVDKAQGEVRFYLRRQRHLRPGEPNMFETRSIGEELASFNTISAAVMAVTAGIVGISLLVGGVGVMNIMLVSVSERTREIGLRKAVGARPSAILLQFLVEAIMLCCLGGAIGVLVGEGLVAGVARVTGMFETMRGVLKDAAIPAWAILLSFGFTTAVGLIFGMFPAIKAARLDPH